MATATKNGRPSRRVARRTSAVPGSASTEFVVFEDNGGSYHWTIVAGDGAALARSEAFGSYDDAEQAAQQVRDGAASARFEDRAGGAVLVDLVARPRSHKRRLGRRALVG
jgi:uncharacterized protein YegP (UPF0339 family)